VSAQASTDLHAVPVRSTATRYFAGLMASLTPEQQAREHIDTMLWQAMWLRQAVLKRAFEGRLG